MIAGLWIMISLAGPVEEGARSFDEGRLDEAVEIWQEALAHGRGSAALHTNLGVGHYRKGDLPRAIAHWRMATVLSPRSADAAHNLAVARSELEGAPPPAGTLPFSLQLATVGEYGALGTLSWLTASIGAWVARLKRQNLWPWIGLAVIGAVFAWLSLSGVVALQRTPGAVVLDQGIALRSEPDLAAPTGPRISPGVELQIERRQGDFLLLRSGAGDRGWVPRSGLAIVGPTLELPEVGP